MRRRRPSPTGSRFAVASLGEHLFVLPIAAVVAVALAVPTVSVVYHAFTNWQPGYTSSFTGLHNLTQLAQAQSFHRILENQAYFLIGLPVWTLLPLVVAVLLHERVPVPGVFRTIFFFPAVVSPALIGVLFSFMLSPEGPLNKVLRAVGLGALAHNWLVDPTWVRPVIIVVLAWATMGVGVVIFSAALSTVPRELFEAAVIDGAGWWQRLRFVVVPNLRQVVVLWLVILVITVFVSIFPWIFTLTRGGPGYDSATMDFDIYQNALQYGYYGTAAAEAVFLLAIVALITAVGWALGKWRGRRVA